MCQFFSALAFRDGSIRFSEDDSHEVIIQRLGLNDRADLFLRGWVRVEVLPDGAGWGRVRVDETSVPGWYEADRDEWAARIIGVADRVQSAMAAYEAIQQPAWAAYEAIVQSAMAAYKAIQQSAWAAYEAIEQPAWAAYEAIQQSAWAAYEAIEQPAWAAYKAIQQSAWAAYLDTIRTIEGYVPERAS